MTLPAGLLNLDATAAAALEMGIHEPPDEWHGVGRISSAVVKHAEVPHACRGLPPLFEFTEVRHGGAVLHRLDMPPARPIWIGRCRACGAVCWPCV